MRCLYCGNELALLKKLTGGGEFCSEAHRQKYQEEYNRLALSRLLQAQPAVVERPPLEATRKTQETAHTPNGKNGHAAVATDTRPTLVPTPTGPQAPAEPGFVTEKFQPVASSGRLFSSEPFISPVSAYLPNGEFSRMPEARMPQPGSVAILVSQSSKRNGRQSDSGPDPREFTRATPKLEVNTKGHVPRPPGPLTDALAVVLEIGPTGKGTAWMAEAVPAALVPSHQLNAAALLRVVTTETVDDVNESLVQFDDQPVGEPFFWDPEFGEPGEVEGESAHVENAGAAPTAAPSVADAPKILDSPAAVPTPEASTNEVPASTEVPVEAATNAVPASTEAPVEAATNELPVSAEAPVEAAITEMPASAEAPVEAAPADAEMVTASPPPQAVDPVDSPAPDTTSAVAETATENAIPSSPQKADSDSHHEVVVDLSIFEEVDHPTGKKSSPAPTADAGSSTGKAAEDPTQAGVELPFEAARENDLETGISAEADAAVNAAAVDAGAAPVADLPAASNTETLSASEEILAAAPANEPAEPVTATEQVVESATPEQPTAQPTPRAATDLMAVNLTLAGPGGVSAPEIAPVFTVVQFRVAFPEMENRPVRAKMIFGPRPEVKPVTPSAGESQPAPPPAAESVQAASPAPAPTPGPSRRESRRKGEKLTPRQPATTVTAVADANAETITTEAKSPETAPKLTPAVAAKPTETPTAPPSEPPARLTQKVEHDDLRLNLQHTELGSPLSGGGWSRMTMSKRIAIGSGLLIAVVVAGFLAKSTLASKQQPQAAQTLAVQAVGPSLATGGGGWAADWGGGALKGTQISLLRPSLNLSDYRIEFQGQMEGKSIGWVFRAASPKNFYVNRLEAKKAGLDPEVALTRYAVINGEETQRSETPLPFKTHVDTVYKVRTDVYGSDFKTYVNDQLVSSWSDDRLKSGGFGLMTDRGEQNVMRLVQLYELRAAR